MRMFIFVLILIVCLYSCNLNNKDFGGFILSENPEYGYDLTLSYADTSVYHRWKDGSRSLQKGVFLKYIDKGKIDTIFCWEGV
jgi:hypothetical protein